jgi:hypothetical protein
MSSKPWVAGPAQEGALHQVLELVDLMVLILQQSSVFHYFRLLRFQF